MEVPEMTAYEHLGPRGYLRLVFPMPLPHGYDMEEAARVLREGYKAARQRLAIIGAEVMPDPDAKQKGAIKWQRAPEGKYEDLVVQDLRAPGAYPYTYAQLKAKKFSISMFDGDVLFRHHIWPEPGEGIPNSMAQANFLEEGLIVGWCLFHVAGDANSFLTWAKVWADECRRLQGVALPEPLVIEDAMVADRDRYKTPSGRNRGRLEDHPEFTQLPFSPPGPAPHLCTRTVRAQVFYFSAKSLAALKAAAAPANATVPTDQQWISTHDAFAALLWRTVVGVQKPLSSLKDGEDPVSNFTTAVDGRRRTDPPVHADALGCWLGWLSAEAPVRKILGSYTLADLAVLVRKEMTRRLSNQYSDDIAALVDQLPDLTRMVPTVFLGLLGENIVLTSWSSMTMCDIEWGPLLGGHMEAVRTPNNGMFPGAAVILPKLPDGGIEVMVGSEGEYLHCFQDDPLWTKYAEAR